MFPDNIVYYPQCQQHEEFRQGHMFVPEAISPHMPNGDPLAIANWFTDMVPFH